ncbi:paeninodin family lasso peptide [Neobacillus rhizosphaerae]
MKKEWEKPVLESLDVSMTMAGVGHAIKDDKQYDPDDFVFHS